MNATSAEDALARGRELMAAGAWSSALAAFETAVAEAPTADALDGLGVTLWWLGDVYRAIEQREAAYTAYRRERRIDRAVRAALWLSREYRDLYRNAAASDGWLARAEGVLEGSEPAAGHGWLELARARREADPASAARRAEEARRIAREFDDPDLEILALARRGFARVLEGDVDTGTRDLDEAMAAATAGEGTDPETLGDALCTLMEAAELLGDLERFGQWAEVIQTYLARHGHMPLLAFCGTCSGAVFAASGRWSEAEQQLEGTLRALQGSGHRSRCVDPAARLAELRIRQGRLEEAADLLHEYADVPETARAAASLRLARDEPTVAVRILERRLGELGGQNLAAGPLLGLLVQARLAQGDVPAARAAAARLAGIASRSGLDRLAGVAALATGRVAAASGDRMAAVADLEQALAAFERAQMPLDAGIAHLELAEVTASSDATGAADEARAAFARFESLGATADAGRASALLRDLGVRARTGPRGLGLLTRRETEVLRLLSQGLTNAEIASRLYISVKTAGHHVSSVLAKLGARTRTEAAALALRLLDDSEEPGGDAAAARTK